MLYPAELRAHNGFNRLDRATAQPACCRMRLTHFFKPLDLLPISQSSSHLVIPGCVLTQTRNDGETSAT